MPKIHYFSEETDFTLKKKKALTAWIKGVITAHGYQLININFVFCSDPYLLSINQQYLDHDTLTDIITFDHSTESDTIASDIYISIDRVAENANDYQEDFDQELHRVMIHGVLHLMGWSDKTTDEQRRMKEKEDACLSLLGISN